MRLRKIIIAPDSFKETVPAVEAARAMAVGIGRGCEAIIAHECPVADGGEGTLETLVRAAGGTIHTEYVSGPLGEVVPARFGIIHGGRTAVIEMAEASGLALVPPERRDPTHTTSVGTGELMLSAAANFGCEEMILCIGGSATVDGGTGIAQGFGFHFFDRDGKKINERMCGALLPRIARFEPPKSDWPRIRVACDVTNRLCGPAGAAQVYGPQKGATPGQAQMLDDALAHLAVVTNGPANALGAGAAGGAGFGLMTFFNAQLERGIDLVLDALHFREHCLDADLVITGEGRLDGQSLQGKACIGVAQAAAELGVPTIAIVGSTGPGAEEAVKRGLLMSYHSLADRYGMERAMRETKRMLADLTEEVVRALAV